MSSVIKTGNAAHDAACLAALQTLHQTLATVTTQAAMNVLYLTYYRACLASAVANGCGREPFVTALRTLGSNS